MDTGKVRDTINKLNLEIASLEKAEKELETEFNRLYKIHCQPLKDKITEIQNKITTREIVLKKAYAILWKEG